MRKDKLTEEIKEQIGNLMEQVGNKLNEQPLFMVHIVLARLYGEVCIESGMDKEDYMKACDALWDALTADMAEEPKH